MTEWRGRKKEARKGRTGDWSQNGGLDCVCTSKMWLLPQASLAGYMPASVTGVFLAVRVSWSNVVCLRVRLSVCVLTRVAQIVTVAHRDL